MVTTKRALNVMQTSYIRRCSPEVFLEKVFWKYGSTFTGEYPCLKVISVKLLCNFIEIALRHGCSPVNLLHVFRTSFYKNTYEGLPVRQLLHACEAIFEEKEKRTRYHTVNKTTWYFWRYIHKPGNMWPNLVTIYFIHKLKYFIIILFYHI